MKRIFAFCTVFLMFNASIYPASAPDIRISDDQGHVLNINSDGTVPISGGAFTALDYPPLSYRFDGLNEQIGSYSSVGRWIDFNNSQWTEIGGGLSLRSNRIHWLKPNDDIDAVIASNDIVGGDTLILTSGANYTIADDIDVSKAITIDCNGATISIATTNKNVFDVTVDNVTIKNCNISSTATGSSTTNDIFQVVSGTTFQNIKLLNNTVSVSGNGTHRVLLFTNVAGIVDGLVVNATTGNESVNCGTLSANSSADASMSLDIRDFKCVTNSSSSGAGDLIYGFTLSETTSSQVLTVNFRNGTIENNELSGTSGTVAGLITASTNTKIIVNAYNVRFDGGDGTAGTTDITVGANTTVTLRDSVLVNDTTSVTGTLTLNGAIYTGEIHVGGIAAGQAVCVLASGALGACSGVVGAGGACTCV